MMSLKCTINAVLKEHFVTAQHGFNTLSDCYIRIAQFVVTTRHCATYFKPSWPIVEQSSVHAEPSDTLSSCACVRTRSHFIFMSDILPIFLWITAFLEPTNLHDFVWILREQVLLENIFYCDSCYPCSLCELFMPGKGTLVRGEISLSQLPTGPESPAPKVWQTL